MQSPFSNLSPVVKNLLIINVLCFLPSILFNENMNNWIIIHFAAFYFDSPFFKPWQIITYMFLHAGWEHIFFNMFALFSFGPIVEYSIGSKKFFNLYFICGIGAILIQLLVQGIQVYHLVGHFTLPSTFQTDDAGLISKIKEIYSSPTLGASGAIFGVLIAFGMLYPNMELMIMFIPVPIKAKYIIPVYILIELTLGVGRFGGDNVAHFAHLGGALIAFILIKIWGLGKTNSFR
ncbi:rhomboid family intramembrane serine protease [Mucilaginibacter sp.]